MNIIMRLKAWFFCLKPAFIYYGKVQYLPDYVIDVEEMLEDL